ncbi:MAG: DUF4080 domain-containing protein [Treponemataceae bacterium]
MKTLIIAINTKFIHQNLAVRLLQANTSFDCDYIEFTIKDSEQEIIDYVKDRNYKIVAFSSYLWNIDMIKKINLQLKIYDIITIIGGVEVSYDYLPFLQDFDYIIKGEGEAAFHHLLDSIINKKPLEYRFNIATQLYDFPIKEIEIEKLNSPYDESYFDKNKIFYLETSRGCPYRCSYCMSSLEQKVRFFPLDFIFETLDKIFSSSVQTIKFLDRTFNADNARAYKIIDYINKNAKDNQIFQFEVNLESLSNELITLLNDCRPLFRLEVGIQTFNNNSLLAIDRTQKKENVIQKMTALQKPIIHADLIAGLPYEDLESFRITFDTTIRLYPEELQLGFLKLLKGTKIRNEAKKYQYEFSENPPYEIQKNQFLSQTDIEIIKKVEHATKRLYNSGSFSRSIKYIVDNFDPFDFFYMIDVQTKDFFQLYLELYDFAARESLFDLKKKIVIDYFMHHNCKPKLIFNNLIYKPEKTAIIRNAFENGLFKDSKLNIDYLYRHAIVFKEETIFLAIYKDNMAHIFDLN